MSLYELEPQIGTPPSLSFCEDAGDNEYSGDNGYSGLSLNEDSLFDFSDIDNDDMGTPFIQRMRF